MSRVRSLPIFLLMGASALAVAAPISLDATNGNLMVNAAFAKHGADDPANHNAGDDRGRNRNQGGGHDDPAGHH